MLTYSFLNLILLVSITVAQDQCPLGTYCGRACCLPLIQRCCATSNDPTNPLLTCCTADSTNVVATCGTFQCPNSLPPEEVYDTAVTVTTGEAAQLRNQCCMYFREGCCSQSENNFLDLLYKLALGLGIGLGGLLVIILILVVCCCCCAVCS